MAKITETFSFSLTIGLSVFFGFFSTFLIFICITVSLTLIPSHT
jgi:hypothetical protein